MSYWDTSALVKLSLLEPDSEWFLQCAATGSQIVTADIARFEARAAFRRHEARGLLTAGGATALAHDLDQDVARGKIAVQAVSADRKSVV